MEYYKNLSLENIIYTNDEGQVCEEIWKDIPEYEGLYQVSNLGRVKSLERMVKGRIGLRIQNKRILSQIKINIGYLKITLHNQKKPKQLLTHQLVAIAFLNHVLDGTNKIVVDHKDNDKLNNNLFNLQLITNRENSSKDKKGGTSKYVGVMWHKSKQKWESRIRCKGKLLFLGLFIDEYEAHLAYQEKLEEIKKLLK